MLSRFKGDGEKRKLFVALYHITGAEDGAQGEAYHWTLLLAPKDEKNSNAADCRRYHVTNILGVKHVPWYYEQRMPCNKGAKRETLICRLQLGKVKEADMAQFEEVVGSPRCINRGGRGGYFSCRVWTRNAVEALQDFGMVQTTAILDGGNVEWEAKDLARRVEATREYGRAEAYRARGQWGFVC